MTRPSHIFISHGSENRDRANELAQFLEARGARAWIAPRDVRPGMDYSEQLQLAIEECAAFVVLVTEDSNKSPYVRVETEMAFSINKPIFPVRVADVKPAAGLALFLKIKHWTDAYGTERDANLERLVRELQVLGALTPPPAPDAAPPPPAAPLVFDDKERFAASPPPPPVATPPAPAQPAPVPPAPEPVLSFGIGSPAPPHQPAAVPGAAGPAGSWPPASGAHPAAAPSGWPPSSAPQREPANFGDEAIQRAMIGPNADHYINSWRRMDATRSIRSFNIAGLLGNFFWLAYRKMWIPLAAGIGVIALADLIAGNGIALLILGWMLIIGFCVALGLFGDHLYRLHLRRAAAVGGGIEHLRARGGTSMLGPAVLAGVAVLAAIIGTVWMSRQSASAAGGNEAREERTKDGTGGDNQEETSRDTAGSDSRDETSRDGGQE